VDLAFHMTQEQTQKLVMTTQMREALSVLEMSSEDLHQYVTERAEQNVFLGTLRKRDRHRKNGRVSAPSASGMYSPRNGPPIENMLVADWTLIDDIKQQLLFLDCTAEERAWALRLAEDLDENGYLGPFSPELMARLNLNETQWQAAVACIQRCDPVGVGARNLQECLLLQVNSDSVSVQSDIRALAGAIIHRHLEDVASGRIAQVARRLKVTADEVRMGLDAIRRLNPRPGSGYGPVSVNYTRPDVSVIETEFGFAVVVTDTLLDMSFRHQSYQEMMRDTDADMDVRRYLSEQWREARWIRRCVVQRQMTLQRIGEAIVQLQPEFLLHGLEHLRPMRLRDIADVLEIHESTVSRAIRHKSVATPVGTIELRQLFSSTLHADSGDVSAAAIKHQIRDFIRSESRDDPLTDAAIADKLQESGVKVSRRTVAKYREAMGIPGSMTRRMQAPMGG
jgi:RNA polymerase sigma-54 factor